MMPMNKKPQSQQEKPPRFFANLLSVVVFLVILGGLFLLTAKVYTPLIVEYKNTKIREKIESAQSRKEDSIVTDIAPFVRGILSGVKSGASFSTQKEKAIHINKVQGYQKGIKTAVLTSLDWYDLDRELFQSQGLMSGITASVQLSRSGQNQFQSNSPVILLEKIQNALSRDISEILENSPSRKLVLDSYIQELLVLDDEAKSEISFLSGELNSLQDELQAANGMRNEVQQRIERDKKQLVSENIKGNIKALQEASNESLALQIKLNSLSEIRSRLVEIAPKIRPLIIALQKNYEALKQDIKVAPVKGVNLPIFKE
jgi:hypothetical protein